MQPQSESGWVLYYRENCHLCESMRVALTRVQDPAGHPMRWSEVDIDRDPELIRRFDTLVPVLSYQGREVCHHFIDEPAIRAVLQQ